MTLAALVAGVEESHAAVVSHRGAVHDAVGEQGAGSTPATHADPTVLITFAAVVAVLAVAAFVLRRRSAHTRLAGAACVGVALAVATAAFVGVGESQTPAHANAVLGSPCFDDSPVVAPFTARFQVPPRARPSSTAGGIDTYDLMEQSITTEIIPGVTTPVWAYDRTALSPTILARMLRPVRVNIHNQLPPNEDQGGMIFQSPLPDHPYIPSGTTVHFHGLNQAHIDDGYAADDEHKHVFTPGQSFSYIIPNNADQRPAQYWYHDHQNHITSVHVYRGLAALYTLTDTRTDRLPLPGSPAVDGTSGYGVFDVPLVLRDPMIDPATGKLVFNNCEHDGSFGDFVAINGRQQPRMEVGTRKYRFRVLNGSPSRQYDMGLRVIRPGSDPVQAVDGPIERFTLIGTDHGLLRNPLSVSNVFITPAQRRELVIDFSRYPVGTRLELVNLTDLRGGEPRKLRPMMAFDVTRRVADPSQVPAVLSQDLDPSTPVPEETPADLRQPVLTRQFRFDRRQGEFRIDGQAFDVNRADAFPQKDTVERWILDNPSGGWGHPIHIHLGKFKIVKIEGRDPFPGEMEGWNDVVWLGPNQRVTVDHQFFNFTGKYVFHCHNADHEDHDMMSQFDVVAGPARTGTR